MPPMTPAAPEFFADPPTVSMHPLVARATALAAALAPDADAVERGGIARARLDRLAEYGLHAVMGPPEMGGAPPAVYRRVAELLAGSDGTTWLVWFQHNPVCRMLAASTNDALADRWLARLCRGETQATVAFAQLRRPGDSVRAERDGGRWRLTGRAPWCTGWGVADLVLVGAVTADDPARVMLGLVPLEAGAGLTATPALRLAAMEGSRTVELVFDAYAVPDDDVVLLAEREPWAVADRAMSANVQPSTFGIAEAALAGLAALDNGAAETLARAVADCRRRAYRLIDEVDPAEQTQARLAVRAEALLRTINVTSAFVAACGGGAMNADHPAQRLARHALFHLVFAQNQQVREATLSVLATNGATARANLGQGI